MVQMHALSQAGKVAPPTAKRRVLIVDDHDFFAACLRTLLDNESDLVVCDIAANSQHLRERIDQLRPDLLVIDLSLGTENGLELGQQLRALQIATPILFVSTLRTPSIEQLATIRHAAFIAKSRAPAEFLAALRGVLTPQDPAGSQSPAEFAFCHATAKSSGNPLL